MSIRTDEALSISNPRLISGIYFSLLSIIFILIISLITDILGISRVLPLAHAIILSGFIAMVFGAFFGECIVHAPAPYHRTVFWLGFGMMLLAVPFYCLGFLFFFIFQHALLFIHATLLDEFRFYLFVVGYSYLLFGIWLAILGGFSALYLRGYLVYYLMNSKYKPTS